MASYLSELHHAAQTWKQMIGVDQKTLSIIYETEEKPGSLDNVLQDAMDAPQVDEADSPSCNGGWTGIWRERWNRRW